ncbi:MAG: right-handed parallel beta-helix repeat-containing protein [Ardenticatenaceae bacterium]
MRNWWFYVGGRDRKRVRWLSLLCVVIWLSAFVEGVQGQAVVRFEYEAITNTVSIGEEVATSQERVTVVTIPELAAQLASEGHPDLLVDQGDGVWLLKANLLVNGSARLEATSEGMSWLRLDSRLENEVHIRSQKGGQVLIEGIKVTSWDTVANSVDERHEDGRSYLLATEGGRMEIVRAEVAYLGWRAGQYSGISWRGRWQENDPTSGATGRVEDSVVHHNYVGLDSVQAYGLLFLRNQVYQNVSDGIHAEKEVMGFEVGHNTIYENGHHGIIFSDFGLELAAETEASGAINQIYNNEVYQNQGHGVVLTRGANNNSLINNVIYKNYDGVTLFRSSNNIIQGNTIRDNLIGLRIHASEEPDDDDLDTLAPVVGGKIATNNQISGNLMQNNSQYGIYLYDGADRNLIHNNRVEGSDFNGIYVKSGGNQIRHNTISSNGHGITIRGGGRPLGKAANVSNLDAAEGAQGASEGAEAASEGAQVASEGAQGASEGAQGASEGAEVASEGAEVASEGAEVASEGAEGASEGNLALEVPGYNNIISGNTITQNNGAGIRLMGAVNNRVGQDAADPREADRNLIQANGTDGVLIRDSATGAAATDNLVLGNTIQDNERHGVLIKDATSVRNAIRRNSITNNKNRGIKLQDGANNRVAAPEITVINGETGYIGGQSWPDAVIEIYHDANGEGQIYDGQTVADAQGFWSFTLFANPYSATAIAIDANGNSTPFSGGKYYAPKYTVQPDKNGQLTILVTGRDAVLTLQDIRNGLGAYVYLLEDLGNGVWQLNANLRIERDVTLNLTPSSGVRELRLRSQNPTHEVNDLQRKVIDHSSFVYLRTHNGIINIDGVKVYSWDPQVGDYDRDVENGRSYILGKYMAELNVRNAEISYLGSAEGESYGLSWRDINDTERPHSLRTRVTGEVINSEIHHNYYGIYTFQATGMTFRGNLFYDNVRYGFDPHDYTHDAVVEHNQAYNNGSHGFIISRGCQDIVFRYNKSFNNQDNTDSLAHGFMLDPGSPSSLDAQSASNENLLEHNQAYDNEGYGLRILGSTNNRVRNNHFYSNLHGIVVDSGSYDNSLSGNHLTKNVVNGILIRGGADRHRIINNTASGNENHGIYVRSNHNTIRLNTSHENFGAGVALVPDSQDLSSNSSSTLVSSNTQTRNTQVGRPQAKSNQQIVGNHVSANDLAHNQDEGLELKQIGNSIVQDNLIENNGEHGIYLSDGANNNHFFNNTIRINGGLGILMSGNNTFGNIWSKNKLYDNQAGGIDMSTGINNQIEPPLIALIENKQISGSADPGSLIEIFSDYGQQGRYFEGRTIATSDGSFSFSVPNQWQATKITAIATDTQGNSSRFAISKRAPSPPATAYYPFVTRWMKGFVGRFLP